MPRVERDRIDELYGFLDQSHISPKNVGRLKILAQHADSGVRQLANLLLEVARVKPYKRRRWNFLAQKHPSLFVRLKALCDDDLPGDAPESLAGPELPF